MRASRVDWLLFAALALVWGSSYLFIKIGVGSLPPFTLISARLAIGALVLGVVLVAAREPLPREPAVYGRLLLMAIVNIAVPFALIAMAERSIDSVLAVILNATVPLFTIVIAAGFLPEEAITLGRLAGLLVGFIGVVVLVGRGLTGGVASDGPWGSLRCSARRAAMGSGTSTAAAP